MNVSNFERTVRTRTKTACVVPLPVAVRDRDVPLSTVTLLVLTTVICIYIRYYSDFNGCDYVSDTPYLASS